MVDWIIDLYRRHVDRIILVVNPVFVTGARARDTGGVPLDVVVQPAPTGMLDAVLLAGAQMRPAGIGHVWVTWCDQVGVRPETVERLATASDDHPEAPVVMPTISRRDPYIHLERDAGGRISRVLHRREGDTMPDIGEGDAGLFSFSGDAFFRRLPEYAAQVARGASTGERNLLPFIPWVARTGDVITFPCIEEFESMGINTPEELRAMEAHLLARRRQ